MIINRGNIVSFSKEKLDKIHILLVEISVFGPYTLRNQFHMIGCIVLFLFILIQFSCRSNDSRYHFLKANLRSAQKNEQYADSVSDISLDFDYISTQQGVRHYIPTLTHFFDDISQMEPFGRMLVSSIVGDPDKLQTLFQYSFRLEGSTAGGFGPPLGGLSDDEIFNVSGSYNEESATDIEKMFQIKFSGRSFEEWLKLPREFREEILRTIRVIEKTSTILDQFLRPVMKIVGFRDNEKVKDIYSSLILPWNERQLTDFKAIDALSAVDLRKLSFATRLLASNLENYLREDKLVIDPSFSLCVFETKAGTVAVYGEHNDTITCNHSLIINTGGDDTYIGDIATPVNAGKPISLLIDMKGSDTYIGDCGFLGSGIFGIGILIDKDGDDRYVTGMSGIASSLFGTSMVYDLRGNDKYISTSNYSIASAIVGAALLIDCGGDDEYRGKSYSQGYGGTMGTAILIDYSGDDSYGGYASGSEKPEFESSFVQGSASGRWAEATDGQSIGGGYGFLIDMEGEDNYSARSFSQGSAYYFGFGMLYDNKGDDKYTALSHSQGYAAHFGLSLFLEEEGNDAYNSKSDKSKLTQVIGSGRDYSAGIFIDKKGDDTLHFGNRSVGIGDLIGKGIFSNLNGNDTYIWYQNDVNGGIPSMGKIIGSDESMTIDYRFFTSKKVTSIGFFGDDSGSNIYITKNGDLD